MTESTVSQESQGPPPSRKSSRVRRLLRFAAITAAALAGLLLVACVALIVWLSSAQSLSTALQQAARHLPAGQTLEVREVQGSMRAGGRIGWLRWQSETLAVEVHALQIDWQWRALLHRQLRLGELHAAQVLIERRGPGSDEPVTPLQQLTLPLDVDLPWRIDELRWLGPPAFTVTALTGRYRYAKAQHSLSLYNADFAQGRYNAHFTLQGAAPMALQARIDARLRAPLATGHPLEAQARARLDGTLAGADARLRIEANIAPVADGGDLNPMQAALQATLAPWAPQPVRAADATLQRIDLARLLGPLWPQAPATVLSGEVHAGPDTAAGPDHWKARITLDNAAPGPWDQARLPLERLDGALGFDGTQWTLAPSTLAVGGGRIEAQGRWRPAPQPWELQATLRKVQPGALHTRLAGAPISGRLAVRQGGDAKAPSALHFDADLKADGNPSPASAYAGLRLRTLRAQGQWLGEVLELSTVRIEAERARLEGHARAQLAERAGDGRLELALPGATANLQGRIAPAQGDLTLAARIDDAAALQAWVQALPGLQDVFGGLGAQGQARLDARWQGGWRSVTEDASRRNARVQATLALPRLELRGAALASLEGNAGAAPVLRVNGLHAELAGTLAQAQLTLHGEAEAGARGLVLDTAARGGLQSAGVWHLALDRLHAQLRVGTASAQRWALELQPGFNTTVRMSGGASTGAGAQFEGSAGTALLRGPTPGELRVEWQPLRLGLGSGLRVQSAGRLRGLPMAWLQAFAAVRGERMANFSDDLIFDGDWSIDTTDSLRAQAHLARRSGDVRVDVGEAALVMRIHSTGTGTPAEIQIETQGRGDGAGGTSAGLRAAELRLDAQGDTVRVTMNWDSVRAGQAQAELSTRLVRDADGGWNWPHDAALAGHVKVRLPALGVWSMLAPPGWRIAGTLDADATLSGSRSAPRWRGTLTADQLALRVAVEGIDLRDGRLRATLAGDRLTVDELSLHGGMGASVRIAGRGGNVSTAAQATQRDGGSLNLQGELRWSEAAMSSGPAPAPAGAVPVIHATLQGRLDQLRVLARTDRNLTLSGTLAAGLTDGQIRLHGQLVADHAAIILPDETAPSLGSDVVVRSAAKDRAAFEAARAIDPNEASGPGLTPRKPPEVTLTFDLGKDFAVQGRGITTRLEGQLQARATGIATPPRLTGEVRTVLGQYRAYGQQLDVESGVLRFNGVMDNPALDILAIRPNIEHRAGVQITGTAQSPRVKLFAEPPLSDAETLSWVMLGRAQAASGGEAVLMQQAALALLGKLGASSSSGNLASRFGLDEIGFRGPGTSGDLSASAVTLGKRLSKDFYVTYERSLTGTFGTLYIFYDLTRRLTLRGQAGQHNGMDLIYTIKYD